MFKKVVMSFAIFLITTSFAVAETAFYTGADLGFHHDGIKLDNSSGANQVYNGAIKPNYPAQLKDTVALGKNYIHTSYEAFKWHNSALYPTREHANLDIKQVI